ncbi:undecaprenyldiphospho-muramoylpentapeptide beta-N-acetylglucosaminyltransferase [Advenella sp. S44]|uniref:undecaprenyldiphospho-muramoylpentapeptide beta-N-acetylglucosaminyltransferase n=1 Tax=Advenella sp. S44 TaxID=1982755 RepID=UPI000C2ACA50|nr:undecaprenyldiphospho-muramoylpentapeptide beta-N-acetylglucosaminyltransferase [Advenella sp. S44]PJX22445.1 undecaprenyldiphospho-muramoylpentapeptide beta-N-acetylglucosaminyltransferase [Advenella sp. S44]
MNSVRSESRTLLVMAGGTGGHIMPGLAVAAQMRERGWQVAWLGNPEKMEGRLVSAAGITLLPLHFAGLRGKGLVALLKLPFMLGKACLQARRAIRQCRPTVVLGMGGYVAVPGGLMARMANIPLVIHEQNAVAGTANKWLAKMAAFVLTGFPDVLPKGQMVGNPVRTELAGTPEPGVRYGARDGALRILVVGGSLGAQALNSVVPAAMALIAAEQRPQITHQAGEQHIASLQNAYKQVSVSAQCVAFIDDMVSAMMSADVIICRAGAMTVAEVAAVGVAALFVPLPHAIDDHQTANAAWLTSRNAAWAQPQSQFTAAWLAEWIQSRTRDQLMQTAVAARACARTQATQAIADICERASAGKT